MALVFKNVGEMLAYVQNACEESMDLVGRSVETILADNVVSSGAIDTGKLLGSIETETGGAMATIKFADGAGHTSLWGSRKMGIRPEDEVYIAHWIDEGRTGTREAANYMSKTMGELAANQNHVDAMVDGLNSYGIKATR